MPLYRTLMLALLIAVATSPAFAQLLKSFADSIISQAATKSARARLLFTTIRDQFSRSGEDIWVYSPLSMVLARRRGNSAEINLLLTYMLRKLDIPADPVILSTRDNGLTNVSYPILANFNYLITRAQVDSQVIFLDASSRGIGYGRLPLSCYNGHARVIGKISIPVFFQSDTLKESRNIVASVANSGHGAESVHVEYLCGYYESVDLRERLTKKGQKEFFRSLAGSTGAPFTLKAYAVDSLTQADRPLA
jgi:hypothetical protein